jgi:hypothetical protein
MFLWYPVMDLARAPRRTARKKGFGYENGQGSSASIWRKFLKSTVFPEIHKTCSKCTLHILQLLCKYFTLLFFKSCVPVAMTHYLDRMKNLGHNFG